MTAVYRVRTCLFRSGERFAYLVDFASGCPLFEPTVFVLTEFRARNLAVSTIEQALRCIKILLMFCLARKIDLSERINSAKVFDLDEIAALCRFCRFFIEDLEEDLEKQQNRVINTKIRDIEHYRMRSTSASSNVSSASSTVRLRYIKQYIRWLIDRKLSKLSPENSLYKELCYRRTMLSEALEAQIPISRRRNKVTRRKGLDEEAQKRLWEVISPNSPENPWVGHHVRARNELIVKWFMALGVRRGELLGIQVRDIDFRKNEVFIARRADNPHDPRLYQPNVKTNDRILPLSEFLVADTKEYVLSIRRKLKNSVHHPILFVANGGRPLSLRGLNQIFSTLTRKIPELSRIFPHLLRHTNNDNLSKVVDEKQVAPEIEKKVRSQLMGWTETSGSADVYTRRSVERKANEVSLMTQRKIIGDDSGKES